MAFELPTTAYTYAGAPTSLGAVEASWSGDVSSGSWDMAQIVAGDLDTTQVLLEAVLTSLLSWRRALPSDVLPPGASREGWFADADTGSRLCLLRHRSLTAETLRLAELYAEEALAWMVAEGIASSVKAAAERSGQSLGLTVDIARPSAPALRARFTDLWSVTDG